MNEDRAFVCRFAMKPCFVLASNHLVKELLDNHSQDTYNGLQDFFFGLFGPNILFAEGLTSSQLRQVLIPLMQTENVQNYQEILSQLYDRWIFREMSTSDPVVPYEIFKKFATLLSFKLFLNLDGPKAEELSELATTHWHGIISVPLSVKLPFLMSSSYRKAAQAREQILGIIEQILQGKRQSFNFLILSLVIDRTPS